GVVQHAVEHSHAPGIADRDENRIGMSEPQRLRAGMIGHLLVELLEMLMVFAFAQTMRELFTNDECDQKSSGKPNAPNRRHLLGEQVDERGAEKNEEYDA